MLLAVAERRGGRQWKLEKKAAWHLGSIAHNVLNIRHKDGWHVFSSALARIGIRACRQ